jgi:hypothetical protein
LDYRFGITCVDQCLPGHRVSNTGLAADSAQESRATGWARLLARPVRRLFAASPMPALEVPQTDREAAVCPAAS